MTTMKETENYMELMKAYQRAISAVEDCKDNWSLERYTERLNEELAKDEEERDTSSIEYWKDEIKETEERNALFDLIEGQLLKLMKGGTIK